MKSNIDNTTVNLNLDEVTLLEHIVKYAYQSSDFEEYQTEIKRVLLRVENAKIKCQIQHVMGKQV